MNRRTTTIFANSPIATPIVLTAGVLALIALLAWSIPTSPVAAQSSTGSATQDAGPRNADQDEPRPERFRLSPERRQELRERLIKRRMEQGQSSGWHREQGFDQGQDESQDQRQAHVRGRRPGRGPRLKGPPLTEAELDQVIEIVREVRPEMAPHMSRMRQRFPDRVSAAIQQNFPNVRNLLRLKEKDPARFELQIEDLKLERQIVRARQAVLQAEQQGDPTRRSQLGDDLRRLVGKRFDVRQKIRLRDLAKMEQKIRRLQDQLARQSENRAKIIDQQYDEILAGQQSPDEDTDFADAQNHGARVDHASPAP